jgi:DNA-binding transcriptional regulator LsrR (DeoR family)
MIKKDFIGGSFCKIPNEILQDANLSVESLGVLCAILSYPPNFNINRDWITRKFNLSDYKVRKVLKELRDLGVLDTKIIRDNSGVIVKSVLELDISDRSKYKLKRK